ncbi:hypothetical protein LZ32DRAFT_606772 [Colletotrichum eremochloae]|nr:hypothetical protein LZ32DRAFT_606772 [Colletotrichum eremochloae]
MTELTPQRSSVVSNLEPARPASQNTYFVERHSAHQYTRHPRLDRHDGTHRPSPALPR